MSLRSDAAPCKNHSTIENKLSRNDLEKIEDNLDIEEKISILFLMRNDTYAFQEIYRLLQNHEEQKTSILTAFIDNHEDNWRHKLLEALCIIQNRQVIRELGILYKELEVLYKPQIKRLSRNINPVAKCLYLLCEELTQEKSISFLQYVKSDFENYTEILKDTDCLELHILYWIQEKYISIHPDGKANLKKLLQHIKRFNDLIVIYDALESYQNNQNVLDNENISSSTTSWLKFTLTRSVSSSNRIEDSVKRLEKGRCIIISQMSFVGGKYETRFGTSADCAKLSETFKGFGFAVDILRNLKKDKILQTLEDIPKTFEPDYDCLFLCILSHGYKGGIISSDEQEVSLEEIERKICCDELKNVIKIVIIQACQGTATGQAREALTTDGPTDRNIPNLLAYRNFCIFMSTLQGFVSVRHKEEGSWFIQELCNVFQTEGSRMTFMDAASKITQRVMDKRGKLNGTNFVAQLPELRVCRLLANFQLPEYKGDR
ncbi:caspase-8 Dredd [Lasioglossum baleicum]|uniref:caspase-8 Dredd n=1 Tax=Lasioglossum baleicum TaxID=434251 RepID=UPI003FCC2E03